MSVTLQDVFRKGFDRYASGRRLPRHVHRAARDIHACRTHAMGMHVRACPAGHVAQLHYNSCRHRACPQCGSARLDAWLQARREQLLPCDHYHVIFTVPHELEPLWHRNRSRMNDLLFRSVRDTLLTLMRDPRHLGATPGILATLHTWGRTLSFHPHIHALVTGGGWDGAAWRPVRNGFLLPVRVVRALFRGKFLAALRQAHARKELAFGSEFGPASLPGLCRALGRVRWNVHVRERYAHADGLLLYLGRYLRGGPIANHRLIHLDDQRVVFHYTDHRDARRKRMALPLEHFIQRVAWHVPEPGRHLIRYWGLYARGRTELRERCRAALPEARPPLLPPGSAGPATPREARSPRCPTCGHPLRVISVWRPGRSPPQLPTEPR